MKYATLILLMVMGAAPAFASSSTSTCPLQDHGDRYVSSSPAEINDYVQVVSTTPKADHRSDHPTTEEGTR